MLRWELKPEGQGCLLVFTTLPGDRANVSRDATGWHFCLDNLEASVDGRPAAAHDKAYFSQLTAEYDARFGLGAFPAFLRSAANRVAADSLKLAGVEAYVFDGADGNQVILCHAKSDAATGEQWRDFDEYLAVLEGTYVLTINGLEIQLGAGREFVIPRGHESRGGTRPARGPSTPSEAGPSSGTRRSSRTVSPLAEDRLDVVAVGSNTKAA